MNNDELIEYAIRTSNAIKEEVKPQLIDYFYKQREVIDKAINDLNIILEIIREQPSENDCWIINRLEANKKILKEV